MLLRQVRDILDGTVVCGDEFLDREVTTACGCDLMSHVLAYIKHDNTLLLTGLTASQTIFIADAVNIKAICLVRGTVPPDDMQQIAIKKEMVLMTVDLPMYEACGKLYKNGLPGCSEFEPED